MDPNKEENKPNASKVEDLFRHKVSGFAFTPKSIAKRHRHDDDNDGANAGSSKKLRQLRELDDHLKPGLDVVFCGINPGEQSAILGHHYANPTNHFWGCLYEGGFTSSQLLPREDSTLPELYNIGLTNLVSRPTTEASELSKSEMRSGVPVFLAKIAEYKPKIVCFVGIGIAADVCAHLSVPKTNGPGLLPFKIVHDQPLEINDAESTLEETLFYAVSSTSGRVVRYQKSDKIKQFQALKALLSDQGPSEDYTKYLRSSGSMRSIRSSSFWI